MRKTNDSVTIEDWSNPPWKSQLLVVGNSAFGLFQPDGNPAIDFVYLRDKNDPNNRDVILYKANPMNLTFSQNGKLVVVQIQGEKDNKSFNLATSVERRNS